MGGGIRRCGGGFVGGAKRYAGNQKGIETIGQIQRDGDNIIVDKNQSTNVEGVFAAGDCTGGIMQIATAVGQGAVAGQKAKTFVRKE